MTDIAASDVTISFVNKDRTFNRRLNCVRLSFTLATLTYPANGVPLPAKSKFGMPQGQIDHMSIMGNEGQGYVWKYDRTNHTLRCYTSAALANHTHDMKFIGGIATTEAVMIADGDTLGKNAATNRTIVGADSATKGGVVSGGAVAAGALTELATGATGPVCTTTGQLTCMVYGK